MILKQILIIVVLAAGLGLVVNTFHPNKIPYVGHYRSLSSGEGPIIPPSAEKGDPPFIAIDVAEMEHSNSKTLFVDARDPEEYECGTIPGAINIPFEYLPEDSLAHYFDSALGGVKKDFPIITFCSGEECDLSLQLGRNLQAYGYTNVAIFFGGAREWEKFGLTMERRKNCEE
jgi:rhodanese-related sulfurtransferase